MAAHLSGQAPPLSSCLKSFCCQSGHEVISSHIHLIENHSVSAIKTNNALPLAPTRWKNRPAVLGPTASSSLLFLPLPPEATPPALPRPAAPPPSPPAPLSLPPNPGIASRTCCLRPPPASCPSLRAPPPAGPSAPAAGWKQPPNVRPPRPGRPLQLWLPPGTPLHHSLHPAPLFSLLLPLLSLLPLLLLLPQTPPAPRW